MGRLLEVCDIFRHFPILWRIPFCRDVNAIENGKAFKKPIYLIRECFL